MSPKLSVPVIGIGGVAIKDLELKTETKISILKSQRSNKLTISGQEHGVDQAVALINRRVKVRE